VSKPRVLIVDDQPHTAANALANNLDRIGVLADPVEPQEVNEKALLRADLILVDYKLDAWPVATDSTADVSRSPRDGLALAAVLASRLRQDDGVHGIALYSAELHMLVQDFSSEVTEHAAARINGIDWAFQKDQTPDLPSSSNRVAQFAEAIQGLSQTWASGDGADPLASLRQFLMLPEASWSEVAMRDVIAAQPPIHQFAESSHGISVLRWLAQRVLPYPTFLLDQSQLALACGVQPESLKKVDAQALDEVFDNGLYRGRLDKFLGPRWWRAAVRRQLREWTDSTQPSLPAVQKLEAAVDEKLTPLDPITSVLGMDEKVQQPRALIARERALRVRPDDWPIFAEPAWVDEELVKGHATLRAYIDPADLARLDNTL
jgi:hypothetical protein